MKGNRMDRALDAIHRRNEAQREAWRTHAERGNQHWEITFKEQRRALRHELLGPLEEGTRDALARLDAQDYYEVTLVKIPRKPSWRDWRHFHEEPGWVVYKYDHRSGDPDGDEEDCRGVYYLLTDGRYLHEQSCASRRSANTSFSYLQPAFIVENLPVVARIILKALPGVGRPPPLNPDGTPYRPL